MPQMLIFLKETQTPFVTFKVKELKLTNFRTLFLNLLFILKIVNHYVNVNFYIFYYF